MANNVFQVKRTNVSGRTPNTTGSYVTNSQYIAAGEFALNMADGILYTSNGSAVITVGANLVNQNITGNLTVKAIIANGSIGSAGQVLTTNSTGVYWSTAGGGSGTVTSVATGNGITGGPITTTGTVSVLANTGIVANSTGLFVNATYIGTLTANNTSFVGTVSAANVVSNAQLSSNLASYQTTAGLSANVATLTANNTSFVGTVSAANVVSNAQLSGNLANYQTTAGLSANVATLTSNNSTFSYSKTEGALNVNNALTANNSTNLGGQAASYYNHRNYTDATNYLGGYYVSGGSELPSNTVFGAGKLKLAMISGTTLGFGGTWNDVLWLSSYNGGDVKTSAALVIDKTGGDNIYFSRQLYDSATWGTGRKLWHDGNDGAASGLDADLLDGQQGAFYTNATNITTGTLPYAQIPANIINTTAAFTISGVHTYNANVVIGTAAGISANGGFGTAGQVLHSNGTSVYWAADDNSGGTVTSITMGNGLSSTQSPLTTSGTMSVVAGTGGGLVSNSIGVFVTQGTGTVVNATGVHVNATYIGTISANNASFLGGVAAASYVQNTDSRTLSGNLVISGTSFTPSTNTILLGNSTQRWVLSANTGSFSGAVSGITTLAAGNTTLTGWISAQSAIITGGGSYTVGSIYSDANWGMLFRAARASPTQAQYAWKSSDDVTEYVRISPTGNVGIGNTAPDARLAVTGTANISGNFTVGGITTFNANVILGSSGLSANGGFGTAGHVLTTNGTATYWAAAAGGGYYKGGSAAVGTLAVGGQNLFRVNANTLNFNTTIAAGENAQATGPIAVAAGITLTVASGARVSIV